MFTSVKRSAVAVLAAALALVFAPPARADGDPAGALWTAPAWTLQPGGVIQLSRPGMTLGEFFAVWGRPLGRDRLLGWTGSVRTFVNGVEHSGDPAGIALHDRDQVVVQIGGYVEPHPSFTFTPRRDP